MSERRSVWLATTEPSTFPTLDGDLDVDVVVIGAGITGLTTAVLLQRDGARVAVVEARKVGGGTTGGTTGKVTSQHGLVYRRLVDRHDEGRAQAYAAANQHAIDLVEQLAGESTIECGFRRLDAIIYATDADQRAQVEAEHAVAVRLGLPA